jgi:hypothetical protein
MFSLTIFSSHLSQKLKTCCWYKRTDWFGKRIFKRNREKPLFGLPEVKFLGTKLNLNGISIPKDYLQTQANVEPPGTHKEMQFFLRLAPFIQKFLPKLGDKKSNYNEIIKEGKRNFTVKVDELTVFKEILETVKECRPICHPDLNRPFVMVSDASKQAVG